MKAMKIVEFFIIEVPEMEHIRKNKYKLERITY